MYKLTIIKYEKNENYEQELAKWKENSQYNNWMSKNDYMQGQPQLEKSTRCLEVVLTDEEYKKIKFDTLTTFE